MQPEILHLTTARMILICRNFSASKTSFWIFLMLSISASLAIGDTFVVASQAAMLALSSAEKGDVAIRTDLSKSFILASEPSSVLANWQELLSSGGVVSVFFIT